MACASSCADGGARPASSSAGVGEAILGASGVEGAEEAMLRGEVARAGRRHQPSPRWRAKRETAQQQCRGGVCVRVRVGRETRVACRCVVEADQSRQAPGPCCSSALHTNHPSVPCTTADCMKRPTHQSGRFHPKSTRRKGQRHSVEAQTERRSCTVPGYIYHAYMSGPPRISFEAGVTV
jgi:hypothetical protein